MPIEWIDKQPHQKQQVFLLKNNPSISVTLLIQGTAYDSDEWGEVAADIAHRLTGIIHCPNCGGSGIFYQNHGPGLNEPLGCDDCCGTGYVNGS